MISNVKTVNSHFASVVEHEKTVLSLEEVEIMIKLITFINLINVRLTPIQR